MEKIKQSVRLVAKTQPQLTYKEVSKEDQKYKKEDQYTDWHLSNEEFIIYIARTSSSRKNKVEDYKKLLNYLIKNKHWSPFEHASYSFEIKTSRAIGAQLLRHRSFTFQEYSQRYAEVTEIQEVELRKQADKNRQSSEEVFDPGLDEFQAGGQEAINNLFSYASKVYEKLIKAGVAKECARMVLPLATSTTIVMTGNVRSWIHFLKLRLDQHAQKEIRELAQMIIEILAEELPNILNQSITKIKNE